MVATVAKHFGLVTERLEVSGWDKLAAQLNHARTVGRPRRHDAPLPVSDFSDLEDRSNVFYTRLRIELHRVLRRSVPLSQWKGWD